MRYGYTPDGKMRYEAAKKMAGFNPVRPDDTPPKPKKRQPTEKDMATKVRKLNDMKDLYARPKRSDKKVPQPKGSNKMKPRPNPMGY